MFENILVPTDGSPIAAQALPTALALGRANHATIHLLRSTMGMWLPLLPTEPVYGGVHGAYDWLPAPEMMDELTREARASLDELAVAHPAPEVSWRSMVVNADPASAILDYACDERIDLIVMSSHGHSGLERWLLGSVAERVLRHAPCPVLVVRDIAPMRRVLIPLDGSDLAEMVLPVALETARLLGASVTLLRVNRPVLVDEFALAPLHQVQSASQAGVHQTFQQRSQQYLEAVCAKHRDDGLQIDAAVVVGRPASAIADYSAQNDVQLIAMATHGHTGLRRWFYGSVTEKVLHAARCSLLIARPRWEHQRLEEDVPFMP